MASRRLAAAFADVKASYFPQWDRAGRWRVRQNRRLLADARCYPRSRVLALRQVSDDDNELHCLLIHCICHTQGLGHGGRWLPRMHRAAEQAVKLGNAALAAMLRRDGERYEWARPMRDADVYQVLQQAAKCNAGARPGRIVRAVACVLGCTAAEFKGRFRRWRKVVEVAKKQAAGGGDRKR